MKNLAILLSPHLNSLVVPGVIRAANVGVAKIKMSVFLEPLNSNSILSNSGRIIKKNLSLFE